MTPARGPILAVLTAWLSLAVTLPAQTPAPAASGSTVLKSALTAAYNLEHDEALALARRAVALDPDNPKVHRGLAAILWLHILFNRGAVTIDHYMGSISKSNVTLPKPDPAVAAEFKQSINRALSLANARLEKSPRDVQANYDAGVAYGLLASYTASVEGSVTSAFGPAKRAYSVLNGVLEREPSRVSAGVVVGTYRYVVSTLNPAMRMFAFVAGMGSGKEKGIALLEAATRDPESRVDASAVLMLIYSREGRHAEVVRIARGLGTEFPRNRLFQLEEGAAAIRAGRADDADAVLTRGIEALKRDTRPKFPSEEAIWHYKRGLARLNLNQPPAASADLQYALGAGPSEWIRGKIQLEVGKLADLAGRRPDALTAYRTAARLCGASADPMCEKEANRYLKQAFSFSGR
jgi:tetratricopeptide (TPR) repeat protein